jgi:hypothetical protein
VAVRGVDGAILGLGWVKHVAEATVTIATAVPPAEAAAVVVGRDKYRR